MIIHCCRAGMVNGHVITEQRLQPDGITTYWRASRPVGHLFGQPVEGEIEAFGSTEEMALENLKKEQDELYESLWA